MNRNRMISVLTLAALLGMAGWRAEGQTRPAPSAASQQERDDYRAAAAGTSGDQLAKGARQFAAKYPQSGLRIYLFEKALRQYQAENDSSGILESARAALDIAPGDPLALVLTATVLADGLSRGDPDRDQKAAEIGKSADGALRSLDHGALPAWVSAEQAGLYRSTLRAMAYSALGVMKLKTGDDSGAEKDLKTAAELAKPRPDPWIWYHLALAQDRRKKYSAAINSVEQAMQLSSSNPQLQRLAELEHDRLYRLSVRNRDSGSTSAPQ